MAKSTSLPGLEPTIIPAITEAAEQYAEKRDARMAMLKEEVAAAAVVLALMHEHNLESYKDTNCDPPVECKIVKGKEKVRVRLKDDEDEESEEEE